MDDKEQNSEIIKILEAAEVRLQEYDAPEVRTMVNIVIASLYAGTSHEISEIMVAIAKLELKRMNQIKELGEK